MSGWTFASDPWDRDLPIDPPTTVYDKYEYQWEQWLNDNYDKETKTVFGIDSEDDDKLYDELWDKFMDEVVNAYYD